MRSTIVKIAIIWMMSLLLTFTKYYVTGIALLVVMSSFACVFLADFVFGRIRMVAHE